MKVKNSQKIVLALTLLVGIFFLFFYPSNDKNTTSLSYNRFSGKIYGTYYNIIYGLPAEADSVSEKELNEQFSKIDRSLSTFVDTSVISKINRNDSTVVLDSFFVTVFNKGLEVSSMTNGSFDMTVAPLVNLWGFGFQKSDSVTSQMVDSLLMNVGYNKIRLENGRIVKENPAIMLDASAIAKGYSCDVIAAFLKSKNCSNYMVEIGGEIVTSGVNDKGNPWVIGITKPTDDNAVFDPVLQDKIGLSNAGMATSGNYRQFYYKDGKRYSHTINPHTGYPVNHNLLSATVIASDCMTADAMATAFMVMGLDSAFNLAQNKEGISAYFIYSDKDDSLRVKFTDSFRSYLKSN